MSGPVLPVSDVFRITSARSRMISRNWPRKSSRPIMSNLKLFYLKNVMLASNGLANLVGAIFVNALLSKFADPILSPSNESVVRIFHIFFTSIAFCFAFIFTLGYEKPIRYYLNSLFSNTDLPDEFVIRAHRKLLNEPFVLLALDLGIWLTAAIVYPALHWIIGSGTMATQSSLANALANGLVTVTLAFFLLEHVLQKRLAPYVFPTGGLYKIPKTVRIRIRMRLAALMVAGSLIPLLFILHLIYRAPVIQSDPAATLAQLRLAITIIICVFLVLAFLLTVLVNRNLISRFNEIVQTLQWVRNGRFDKKVRVTSNDEIGYTGDIINEMTEGLIERERMQQSLNLAREVQQNLLPRRNMIIDGFEIAGKSIYCDETGGDYFDFIGMGSEDEPRIGVAIGDVSGHGIPAALLMAAVRSSLRLRASLPGGIGATISDVNRQLVQDVEDSGQFMTMFFLVLESESGRLEWVRAGHDPAIVYDPNSDAFNELGGPGIALGVDRDWEYEENLKTDFFKDHVIFLSTDGVWEVRNQTGEMLGKDPILNVIRQNATLDAAQINEAIFDRLAEFIGNAKIEDDITSVVIKVKK